MVWAVDLVSHARKRYQKASWGDAAFSSAPVCVPCDTVRILVLALQYVSGRYRWLELQMGLPQHLAVMTTYLNTISLAVEDPGFS